MINIEKINSIDVSTDIVLQKMHSIQWVRFFLDRDKGAGQH